MSTDTLIHDELFICPTFCGCGVTTRTEWRISQALRDRCATFPHLATLLLREIREKGLYDEVDRVGIRIDGRCFDPSHLALTDPDALFKEIYRYHGVAQGPFISCGCKLWVWWDDQDTSENKTMTAIHHPYHAKQCEIHAHLSPQEQFNAVIAEAWSTDAVRDKIAKSLHIPSKFVPFDFDSERRLIISVATLKAVLKQIQRKKRDVRPSTLRRLLEDFDVQVHG